SPGPGATLNDLGGKPLDLVGRGILVADRYRAIWRADADLVDLVTGVAAAKVEERFRLSIRQCGLRGDDRAGHTERRHMNESGPAHASLHGVPSPSSPTSISTPNDGPEPSG